MALTQQTNAVCERLDEAKELPCETLVHVLTGLTWCSVPEFVVPFELMLNTEFVRQMESGGATVNDKRTLERAKKITLMANNPFHSLNVSNTWKTTRSHNKRLGTYYNCDTEYHMAPKCPLYRNEDTIKRANEAREASRGRGSVQGKGSQCKNDRGKWKRDKDKSNGGDNKNDNRNNFGNCVHKRVNSWV